MIWQSNSEKETFAVAEEIARQASPGDIYLLEGDLGVGKTVFAKGFARGLGITEPVTSPTFTIVQEYHEGRLPLYHLDCEGYFYGDGVCLIEWASQIRDILPDDCHQVTIAKDLEKGFDFREITLDEMR